MIALICRFDLKLILILLLFKIQNTNISLILLRVRKMEDVTLKQLEICKNYSCIIQNVKF